jgi:hypothetical protein
MEITARSRTDLKSYFRKNSIPTESQFAELINGMLNQKEDGLVKLLNDPLSLQAVGDNASDQPLLHFYRNFQDPSPAWKLTLNPRSDPNNAESARAGLNISDGDGQSRLFIDLRTGNVGIGTTNPEAKLDVYATGQTHRSWYEAIRFSQTENSAITLPSGGLLLGLHSDRNFYFADIKEGFKKYVMSINADTGNVGIGPAGPVARLEVAVDATDGDTIPLYIGKGPAPYLFIRNNGNVGIGTTDAEGFRLHVAGSMKLGGFTENDADEWPNVVWLRELDYAWDEGLIKHASSKGVFSRAGFGIHMHHDREFGFWSTNWTPLFAIKGGSGDGYFRGKVGVGASIDAAFTFEPSDASPNAGYIRFGDNTGWKLHFGRSRESGRAQLNTGITGVLMTLQDNGNIGIGTSAPKAFQVTLPEASKQGVAPGEGVTIAGGANASIELRGTGTPYIDFAKDADQTDYHARIWLTATDQLTIEGANVRIPKTLTVTDAFVAGDLAVPGGVETLRMLRGIVETNGAVLAGDGFTVRRASTGLFDITFSQNFRSIPGASATQIFGDVPTGTSTANHTGGDTRDNAVITHLSANMMRVKTGGSDGNASDRRFSFIVIGPR